jgi:benzodiazapine receptor
MTPSRATLRSLVNAIVLVGVLVVNGMAGAGTLSGESIGVLANRYASYFLPAGYVFGIWSLIYLALIGFVADQLLPGRRHAPVLDRVGWGWVVNGVLNVAWVVLFSFGRFGAALVVMVLLLADLVVLHLRIRETPEPLSWRDRIFVAWPFDLYLAWISVALIANVSQYLTYLEWGGWGIPGQVWSVLLMGVATAVGGFMALRRWTWIFPLVVAWAVWGIGARYADLDLIRTGAIVLTGICVVLAVAGLAIRRRPTPNPV